MDMRVVAGQVVDFFGRSTLALDSFAGPASAWWYREPRGEDRVRDWLVTADAFSHGELGRFQLRADCIRPEGRAADEVLFTDYFTVWTRLDGVAVMPSFHLESNAERRGYEFDVDAIPRRFGATEDQFLATANGDMGFVLGHSVEEGGQRPPHVGITALVWDRADRLTIPSPLGAGFVGGPVFAMRQRDDGQWKLVCLGTALPGLDCHPVASFATTLAAVDLLLANAGLAGD